MKYLTYSILVALAGGCMIGGCNDNAGDHPPVHPTLKVEDMTKQQMLDRIAHSPLPQKEKDRLTREELAKS